MSLQSVDSRRSPRALRPRGLRVLPRLVAAAALVLVAAASTGERAAAQVVRDDFYVTNGKVRAATVQGNTLYIGGDFTFVGPATGFGVPIDTTSGLPVSGFPRIEGTSGAVFAAASDGAGGWYIGGSFTKVGGVSRFCLAHVLSDNSVSPWNPSPNGSVYALAVSGSTVYVGGGGFTSIGGQARNNIAAINATTGLATSWNPNANNKILTIVPSGSKVYTCGWFTSIGGQPRRHLAALEATTGLATTWNPSADSTVFAVAPSGGAVYVGGIFGTVGGQTRNFIAALDTATGLATAWNPNASGGPFPVSVRALAVSGSVVYAGGYFSSIGGQTRNDVAALDASSGLATTWNPNADGTVNKLVVGGNKVYVGGQFFFVGGQLRYYVAALNATTGLATPWNPSANAQVEALAVGESAVFLGGDFSSVGSQTHPYAAALNATTGVPKAWNPNPDGPISTLAVSGSTVYAGGDFTSIGGQPRNRIAALDTTTGLATSWNPNADAAVLDLAPSGSLVYAAGDFTTIGGQSRHRIAALDVGSGLATTWNPNADSTVYDLALGAGRVYAAGSFTSIGGQSRNRIAALIASSGNASNWNPNAGNTVFHLAVSGNTVYAGGDFTTLAAQSRNRIAAVDTAGALTAWNPNANGRVRTVELDVGSNTVYAGGAFTTIGGQTRNRICALDGGTGLATPWNANAADTITTLVVNGSTLYAGGTFTTIGGLPLTYLAAITISCPAPGSVGNTSATLAGPQLSVSGDFDGDGALDVAMAVGSGAQVLHGYGDGRFGAMTTVSATGGGRGITTADFNNDGVPDLAFTTSTNVYVARGGIINGKATGSFGPPDTYSAGGNNPTGLAVGDVNGDGINDLVVAVTGLDKIAVLPGLGNGGIGTGGFGTAATYPAGSAPWSLVLADFNGDRILDAAVSNSGATTVSVLLGTGTGAFGAPFSNPVAGMAQPIVAGDFDENGIVDLAVGTASANAVSVLIGNGTAGIGNGTFATAANYMVSGAVRDIKVADFDADGRADLAAVLADGSLQYLFGDGSSIQGNGSFTMGLEASLGGVLSTLQVNAFVTTASVPTPLVAQSDLSQLLSLQGGCSGGVGRTLEMVSPNGGELLVSGHDVPIEWTMGALVMAVNIELSRDDGAHWQRLASNQTSGHYLWRAVGPGALRGRMRVVDANLFTLSDESNGSFRVDPLLDVPQAMPGRPSFSAGYPNPASGAVRFTLRLPTAGPLTVEVFDLAGRRVRTLAQGTQPPGESTLSWDGREASGARAGDGVYFVRARMAGLTQVRRVVRIQ